MKKSALRREFHTFQKLTASIPWCKQYLWEPSSPAEGFTLSNWVQIDSWLRSRSLELPGLGICLIPFLDMVNHSDDANAYYSLDDDGNVVLLPIEANDGETLLSRDTEDSTEIRIKYISPKNFISYINNLHLLHVVMEPTNPPLSFSLHTAFSMHHPAHLPACGFPFHFLCSPQTHSLLPRKYFSVPLQHSSSLMSLPPPLSGSAPPSGFWSLMLKMAFSSLPVKKPLAHKN